LSRRPTPDFGLELFGDHAAGDAIAGVAGGIGLHIIGFGVNDDGGATVAEEGMGAVGKGDVFVVHAEFGFAFRIDGKVEHVAGVVAFGIVQAVFLAVGIEVRAGGFEVWSIALGILMKVNGMRAEGKIVKLKPEVDTRSLL